MYIVVYDDEQRFVAAFKGGKLARVDDETQMPQVQGGLFAAAVVCSLPRMAITLGQAPGVGEDTTSDFGEI